MSRLILVTGNANKAKEIHRILSRSGVVSELVQRDVDLPELQGEPEEIAKEKCRIAVAQVKAPVIVEDTSLCFNALGGLPGPYVKWFLQKTGHDGLVRILSAYDDKSAYAQCIFAFSPSPGVEPVVMVGRCHGRIVSARGPNTFGWDPVFQPDGSELTFAEMDKETKNSISHRAKALEKLVEYFKSNPNLLQ